MNEPNFYEMIGFQSDHPEPQHRAPDAPDLDRVALFLDVDGTLVDIAERPDAVSIPATTRSLVNDLHAGTGGATVLISGRRVGDLEGFFPDFEGIVIGSHGAERREDGEHWQHAAHGSHDLERLVQMIRAWADSEPGLLVEEKPCSVVLHFRQAPDRMAEGLKFMQCIADHAEGFMLHRADMAAEIHPEDVSKRQVIEMLMERWPSRLPIAFGDNLTDEGMFEAVNRLGGHSVKVGHGETCARFRLAGPGEVSDTLRDWLGAGGR